MTAHQSLLVTLERTRQTARIEQRLSSMNRASDQLEQARGNVLDRTARLEQSGTFRACSPNGPVRLFRATRQTALLLEAEARGVAQGTQETA